MNKETLFLMMIVIHIIGAIFHVVVHHKTGVLKQAAKHGDGIRYAKPSDIIVMDCVAWEFTLLMSLLMYVGEAINDYYN